jgi:hypothetical protein
MESIRPSDFVVCDFTNDTAVFFGVELPRFCTTTTIEMFLV